MDISDYRTEYTKFGLHEKDLNPDPFKQFEIWFDIAREAHGHDANAMALATVSPEGIPSNRIVLLKKIADGGFCFFTNYESPKGQDLKVNPNCCANFFWPELERQVRVTGQVQKLSREASVTYAQSRPRKSQLGTWVSQQGKGIQSRESLEKEMAEIEARYQDYGTANTKRTGDMDTQGKLPDAVHLADPDDQRENFPKGPIPVPDYWGGYAIIPTEIEFWQGRANRLHDRLVYIRMVNDWHIIRRSP